MKQIFHDYLTVKQNPVRINSASSSGAKVYNTFSTAPAGWEATDTSLFHKGDDFRAIVERQGL